MSDFKENLPADDYVWYVKISSLGYLVHTTEILADVTV